MTTKTVTLLNDDFPIADSKDKLIEQLKIHIKDGGYDKENYTCYIKFHKSEMQLIIDALKNF